MEAMVMEYKIPCSNCKGKGQLAHFKHVEDGICFKCYGSKVESVSKATYDSYIESVERLKRGKYILFNIKKDKVEYYKTKKEIYSKYGNFYCGRYGCQSSYKDEDIVYTISSKEDDILIIELRKEYELKVQKEARKEIMKQLDVLNGMLEDADAEFKEIINIKIDELNNKLTNHS